MPGSMELAKASIMDLKISFHIMGTSRRTGDRHANILEVFDTVDTLNKAAKIYLYVHLLRS